MIMNIIMCATMLPTMLIICLLFRNYMIIKQDIVLGVRLPKELVESEPVEKELRLYKRRCSLITLLLCLIVPLFFLTPYVSIQFTGWMFWLFLGLVIICIPYVKGNKAIKELRRKYLDDDPSVYTNRSYYDSLEEDHWIWGMFYYNPKDPRVWVDKRLGIGTTTNIATKPGKICCIIAVLALIWIPFMCGWMILEDFTPMHLSMKEDTLVCSHVKDSYKIPIDQIKEVQIMDTLPEDRVKRNGTATDYMEKGKFACDEYGVIYEFLRSENSFYLLIKTSERTYIINGFDDNETMEIYQAITETP